jgi:hypothetical protein
VIENPYYVLTPQISPLWDDSWKVLVHPNYHNEPVGNIFKFRDPYMYSNCFGDVSIQSINTFKFGGGLATVISSKLAKIVNLP